MPVAEAAVHIAAAQRLLAPVVREAAVLAGNQRLLLPQEVPEMQIQAVAEEVVAGVRQHQQLEVPAAAASSSSS
jgi:hypothetical protein